jgi:uncharacterized membrane protein YfcA
MPAKGEMDFLVIGSVAFAASALTFFSGFGLGTLLLPAFALFFSAPAAVAATGVVHLLNNLFKGTLIFRTAHWPTVLRFGVPAVPGAIAGALLLAYLGKMPAFRWSVFGREFVPSTAGIIIGVALIVLAVLELMPWFQKLSAPPRWVPLGGLLMGFSGGLTGQQGALRSIFLLKAGLDAPRFIATGTMVSIFVDVSRLPTYFASFTRGTLDLANREGMLVAFGTACAFAGAWLGASYFKKATIEVVRHLVAALMLLIGMGLIFGVLGT